MRALSIRQPYAEGIFRGIKSIEYRSRPTRILGQRFYIYASKQPGDLKRFAKLGCEPGDLPIGVLVSTAIITRCTKGNLKYEWHLTDVRRLKHTLRKPKRMPQPVWFTRLLGPIPHPPFP